MSDHADVSDKRIEQAVIAGLDKVRRASSLHSDGRCHFCDEPVPDSLIFCDIDCRDDYERELAARRRAGQ